MNRQDAIAQVEKELGRKLGEYERLGHPRVVELMIGTKK